MAEVFDTIMVATDGSRAAQKAVAFAVQFAQRHDSKLIIATVSNRPAAVTAPSSREPDHTPEDGSFSTVQLGMGGEVLKRAAREAKKAGFTNYELLDAAGGNVGATIVKEAEAAGADHLVVGSIGATGLKRLLLGSTASSVIHHAHCPVTVVR
jgi:nucleotide-binding universal stress UspA family protein